MRIALYFNVSSGGAKRTIHDMVKRLSEKHSIDAYSLSCSEHQFGNIQPYVDAYKVYPFSPIRLLKSPWGRANQAFRYLDILRLRQLMQNIAQQIDIGNYDVAFVHPCQFTNSPSILQYLHTSTVFYCHEVLRRVYEPNQNLQKTYYSHLRNSIRKNLDRVDPFPGLYFKLLANEDRRSIHSAGSVLVNSQFSQQHFKDVYRINTHICYLGIDDTVFKPYEITRSHDFISVGALRPDKGFDFLIGCLALLPERIRPVLNIVSNYVDEGEKYHLDQLAKQLNVTYQLHLSISDDVLVRMYNQALLMIYAPVLEPFGLAPVESMACATPVVGVAEGGVRETIIDKVTGLQVERDTHKFSEAIRELLEKPQLLQKYGNNARRHVLQNWTWEKAIQRLELYLQKGATVTSLA